MRAPFVLDWPGSVLIGCWFRGRPSPPTLRRSLFVLGLLLLLLLMRLSPLRWLLRPFDRRTSRAALRLTAFRGPGGRRCGVPLGLVALLPLCLFALSLLLLGLLPLRLFPLRLSLLLLGLLP